MSTAHTPGPWAFEDEFVRAGDVVIADPYCEETASTRPGEMEANARLIAAAPDLLEACEELLHVADDYAPDIGSANGPITRALAAIGKAKGDGQTHKASLKCGYQVTPSTCSKPGVSGTQEIDCEHCDSGTAQAKAAIAKATGLD